VAPASIHWPRAQVVCDQGRGEAAKLQALTLARTLRQGGLAGWRLDISPLRPFAKPTQRADRSGASWALALIGEGEIRSRGW